MACSHLTDDADSDGGRMCDAGLAMLTRTGVISGLVSANGARLVPVAAIERALIAMIIDPRRAGSLASARANLQRAAFAVKDRISQDTWRVVARMEELLSTPIPDAGEAGLRLGHVLMTVAALSGMAAENTTRGTGWRFLDLGRRLERAMAVLDLLGAAFAPALADERTTAALEGVLEACDSAITFRTRYLTSLQEAPLLDLLLTDASNPRSVAFQTERIAEHVAALPRAGESALPGTVERLAMRLQADLRLADPVALCTTGRTQVGRALDDQAHTLAALSDAITTAWLAHLLPSRNQ